MLPRQSKHAEPFALTGWTFGIDFDALVAGTVAKVIARELDAMKTSYDGVSLDLDRGGVIRFDMPIFSGCGDLGPAWEATIDELASDFLSTYVTRDGAVVGAEEVAIVRACAEQLRAAAAKLENACAAQGTSPREG